MDRGNFRSLLSKMSLARPVTPVAPGRTPDAIGISGHSPSALLRSVGRALGLGESRASAAMLDGLEQRAMLEGSFATAIVVALNGAGQGNSTGAITPATPSTDDDYYKFVAPANDFVTVLADTANESPASNLDTKIKVYAEDQTTIVAQGVNNGRLTRGIAKDGWAGFVAQAGKTYYVVVSSEGAASGTYSLRVDAQTTGFDIGGEAPVDTGIGRELGAPVPNPPAQPIVPILGQLSRRQEDIVYKYVAPAGTLYNSLVTVNAQSTQVANLARRLDTRLDVYNAQGQPVANANDSDSGRINDAFTTFKANPGDVFYVRVRSDEIANANVNLATGPFFLVFDGIATELALNPVTRVFTGQGAFTGFGDPSTPAGVPNPTFQTDSYQFRSLGAGTTIITVQPTGLAPVSDPAIRLYDANGTLIAFNDNFVGTSSQFEVQLDANKTYYLVVDGFEINSQVQYTVDIESNHTFDPSTETPNDDHVNNPIFAGGPITAQVRREFQKATMLQWGPARLTLDGNNNPLRDRGYVADAVGTGRIYRSGDTDLFQFVPQVDMLNEHSGDNNDAGTSLFIGGAFNSSNPNTAYPVTSRSLMSWDASDYWYAGAQYFDAVNNVTYGFNDNTDTPLTAGPQIYAMYDWDPFPTTTPANNISDHILMIGGDFTLVVPGLNGPQFFRNLIGWAQDPNTGEWGFTDAIGSANAPVRAFSTFDPVGFDPDGSGPAPQLPDPSGVVLAVGGDFTDIGGTFDGTAYTAGTAANFLGSFDVALGGWTNRGAGLNGSVRALTTFDPVDPGAGRDAQPGPPPLNAVADPYDPPISLIVGGSFTGGITTWDGRNALTPLSFGSPGQTGTVNGTVNALAVVQDLDPDGAAGPDTDQEVLVVGGQFTNAGPLTGVGNIAKFGRPNADPATSDPALPAYAPFLKWETMDGSAGITGGTGTGVVYSMTTWDPPDINGNELAPILVIGGDFNSIGGNPAGNIGAYGSLDPASTGPGALFSPFGLGANGIVRSVVSIAGGDLEEPSIEQNLRTGNPQNPLYLGGDFTTVQFDPLGNPITALGVAQFSAQRGLTADFFDFSAIGTGGVARSADASTPSSRGMVDPAGASGDAFGHSVAVYGDTMAVGSWLASVNGNAGQGSVSIYTRISGKWTFQATVTALDGSAGDHFGSAIALMGDTLLVGASGDDIGAAADRGSAYVFTRAGNTWTQATQLLATGGLAGDAFGSSVALFNGTAIVGAPLDDVSGRVDQGSAYTFLNTGGNWAQQAQLNGTGGLAGDHFGASVGLYTDTAVVGVDMDDVGANVDQGSAFVFTRAGVTWSQRTQITATGGAAGDHFGRSIGVWNRTLVVGAPDANVGAVVDQGSAFVFTGAGAAWAQSTRLNAGDGAANDHAGSSVAIWDTTIVMGAPGADVNGNVDQGAAYTFSTGGTQIAKDVDSNGAAGDLFGTSVAICEGTVVAGAEAKSVGGNAAQGEAFAFDGLASVFSLASFDDGNPFAWDHHDRRASRLSITLAPDSGSFLNCFVRVYDSNFNLVYDFGRPGSNTISPPFPDPAGMIDESLAAPGGDLSLEGIKVWGGETYYIEVSAGPGANGQPAFGMGRYTLNVTADALALDVPIAPATTGDGVPDEINATWVPEPIEGAFAGAIKIAAALNSGDGTNIVNANTQPLHGNSMRMQKVSPSLGAGYQMAFDDGIISTLTDSDLYYFRAEFTGTAEIRLATVGLVDTFGEQIGTTFRGDAKSYSSNLDGALRIFNNDFQQLGYNNDASGINSEFQTFTSGGVTATYRRTDPRIVVNVEAGKQYFIQVESGQRYQDGSSADPAARTLNLARETNWATATGSYIVVLNGQPSQAQDIENGVSVTDDHTDSQAALATVIPVSNAGTGTMTGVINNTPTKPQDTDLMRFITPGFGSMTVKLTNASSSFNSLMRLFLVNPATGTIDFVADGQPLPGGLSQAVTTAAQAGQEYIVLVTGLNNTEGSYTVDVSGVPFVDDHADFGKWSAATDIKLYDFLGSGEVTGNIEVAGDTDIFRFQAITYQRISATVTSLDSSLIAAISIYEVSEDPSGNPIFLRIGNNDNPNNTATASVLFPVSTERTIDVAPVGAGPEDRTYPYYYVVVKAQNPAAGNGRYKVTLNFTATDDHADGSTTAPFVAPPATVYDTAEFSYATNIAIDSATGRGNTTGTIEKTSDSDLFKFAAPANGEATILISRPSSSIIRPMVTIVDANANIILDSTNLPAQAFGEDDNLFFQASVTISVTRGQTYYIIVQGYEDPGVANRNTTITGDYTVSVNASPIDDYPNVGEFTLSNTQAVINLNAITGIGQLGGNFAGDASNPQISPSGDTDLFNFTTRTAGDYSITITPFNSAVGRLAPKVTLFAADGTQLQQVAATAALQTVTLNITGAATGVKYYVLVGAKVPILLATATGEYSVRIVGPGSSGGTDPGEIDFASPTVLTLNPRNGEACFNDQINVAGDRDLFKFRSLASGKTFVQIVTPQGSLLDASLSVYNQANELITSRVAFDADGYAGVTANLSFNAVAGTDYWVVVDGLGNSVGSYQLCVKAAPTTYQLYFPEGFASDQTREFVSIVNSNAVTANYTVYLRYETSDIQTVISSGTVGASARGGVTIIDGDNYISPGVRKNEPYSVIIESDQPLGATLAHYDFGSSIGDSFTEKLSTQWNFARAERDAGNVLDFVVFYNPSAFDVDVTLTAYQNDKPAASLTKTFVGHRRGGFSLNDIPNFPTGLFSVVLTSKATNSANQAAFEGVAASLSHYETGDPAAWGLLGDPDNGATAGSITNFFKGSFSRSEAIFFNPNDVPVTVSLTGSYLRSTLPQFSRTFDVKAKGQVILTDADFGLIADQPVGLRYTSSLPITVNSANYQRGDGDSSTAATTVGTRYLFGDAYMDSALAGIKFFEYLYLYNPTAANSTVAIRLNFLNGTNSTFNISLDSRGFAEVRLHERTELLSRVGPTWFAVDASSASPFAMTMTHYDLNLGGGWATTGVPLGFVNTIARIS